MIFLYIVSLIFPQEQPGYYTMQCHARLQEPYFPCLRLADAASPPRTWKQSHLSGRLCGYCEQGHSPGAPILRFFADSPVAGKFASGQWFSRQNLRPLMNLSPPHSGRKTLENHLRSPRIGMKLCQSEERTKRNLII